VCKQPELSDRASALSGKPLEGKPGFLMGALQQGVAKAKDLGGDGFQKDGAEFRRAAAEARKGQLCGM
jgi:hypothetical protein